MRYRRTNIPYSNRLLSEEEFHDKWASSISIDNLLVHESFEAITAAENRLALKEYGDLSGRSLLDVGCGAGESSVYFALKGAKVTALDISGEMLQVTSELAKKYHTKIEVLKLPIEDIASIGKSFDLIYGNGTLHHVNLKIAARELAKVLSQNGKAIFIEPLSYNPVIRIYRKLAAGVRSPDERPLSFRDIRYFQRYFWKVRHTEFWFFSLWIFISFFLRGLDPSEVRYWRYVIEHAEDYKISYRALSTLDSIFLKVFPFLGRFCWNTVIILEGPISAK